MPRKANTVSESRNYLVKKVTDAKLIATRWLEGVGLDKTIKFGLPEVDDRYHVWRVPLLSDSKERVGEAVIDCYTSEVVAEKSTSPSLLEARLLKRNPRPSGKARKEAEEYPISNLRNTVAQGDCIQLLSEMPARSVDLIFTSPPYFNARPEYSEYEEYEQYLAMMRAVIRRSHGVLNEGRFFVMNTAPVLLRRASRSEASRRIAVPFDLHRIFIEEGYDFIDDIVWMKPEGAGWATGRGRRFAADRNPLQYKAVPVTEYVMVYRKRSSRLIDWHIRNHPDAAIVANSKVADDYERTNVWKINPNTRSKHPAAFPCELAEKVIKYYSFIGDVVLDPFAGSGTVGMAAAKLGRRFVLLELNPTYIDLMRREVANWMAPEDASTVLWMNCKGPSLPKSLFSGE
jgi:DNA modification methylase